VSQMQARCEAYLLIPTSTLSRKRSCAACITTGRASRLCSSARKWRWTITTAERILRNPVVAVRTITALAACGCSLAAMIFSVVKRSCYGASIRTIG